MAANSDQKAKEKQRTIIIALVLGLGFLFYFFFMRAPAEQAPALPSAASTQQGTQEAAKTAEAPQAEADSPSQEGADETEEVSSPSEDILSRFKKPIPPLDFIPEPQFIEETTLYQAVPYGDPLLGYTIRIPKTWQKATEKTSSNFQLSSKLFTDLNMFYGPPQLEGQSRLEIKAIQMEYQLTAEQWFLQYILTGGYTTEGFVVHDKNNVEAVMMILENDTSYVVRTRAQLNGKRMILVQYHVPLVFWNKERVMQAQVLRSFKLNRIKDELIEELEKFQFLDIAEIFYPKSWQVSLRPLRSVERMNAKFTNIKEVANEFGDSKELSTDGQVDAMLVSGSSAESLIDEISAYKRNFESTGMLIGDKIERLANLQYNPNFSFAVTEIYSGMDSNSDHIDYEIWFSVLVSGDYYYFLTLLTPSRNESFSVWARNTEAYKILVQSLTPVEGGFLE